MAQAQPSPDDPETKLERRRRQGREAMRRYRLAHPERVKSWEEANREKVREYNRKWRLANPERCLKYTRAWRLADPARATERTARYKARKLGSPIIEVIDRDAIIARDKSRCHICGKRVPKAQIHLDHLIPVSLGGSHSAANLAVAHARCNLAKGARAANDQLRLVG